MGSCNRHIYVQDWNINLSGPDTIYYINGSVRRFLYNLLQSQCSLWIKTQSTMEISLEQVSLNSETCAKLKFQSTRDSVVDTSEMNNGQSYIQQLSCKHYLVRGQPVTNLMIFRLYIAKYLGRCASFSWYPIFFLGSLPCCFWRRHLVVFRCYPRSRNSQNSTRTENTQWCKLACIL